MALSGTATRFNQTFDSDKHRPYLQPTLRSPRDKAFDILMPRKPPEEHLLRVAFPDNHPKLFRILQHLLIVPLGAEIIV
jgi:hypothetical protein